MPICYRTSLMISRLMQFVQKYDSSLMAISSTIVSSGADHLRSVSLIQSCEYVGHVDGDRVSMWISCDID